MILSEGYTKEWPWWLPFQSLLPLPGLLFAVSPPLHLKPALHPLHSPLSALDTQLWSCTQNTEGRKGSLGPGWMVLEGRTCQGLREGGRSPKSLKREEASHQNLKSRGCLHFTAMLSQLCVHCLAPAGMKGGYVCPLGTYS